MRWFSADAEHRRPKRLPDENDNDNGGVRSMRAENISMGEFALIMKFFVDRPVVDQTGLAGRYDFELKWTFDDSKVTADSNAVRGLFTATQKQLGLKLGIAGFSKGAGRRSPDHPKAPLQP